MPFSSAPPSAQDLKDYMRQAGEVSYADAHRNRRNEGVVEFGSRSDMKRAMEKLVRRTLSLTLLLAVLPSNLLAYLDRQDGTELNGRKIKLVDCYKRRSYSRSRSPPPKRSRSRSRSRSRGRGGDRGSRRRSSNNRSRSPRSRSRSRDRKASTGGKDEESKSNGKKDR